MHIVYSYACIIDIICAFQYNQEHFNLIVTSCPPGLALYPNGMKDEFECRCNDDNDQNIIRWQPDEGKLTLKV